MPAPMITTCLRSGGPLGRCLNEQACLPSEEGGCLPSEAGGCSAIVLTIGGCVTQRRDQMPVQSAPLEQGRRAYSSSAGRHTGAQSLASHACPTSGWQLPSQECLVCSSA